METKKLFYDNAYQVEFEATVLFCGKESQRYFVILDQTAFYPEGGGQPSDQGILVWRDRKSFEEKQTYVSDVQYKEENIRHYVEFPVEVGTQVKGNIIWDRRFDLMQQHSGEHLVSGFIHKLYGYDNVGFHMGEEVITIDLSGMIEKEQLVSIEQMVNSYIWTDQKTNIFFPNERERESLFYRSKKQLEGKVRIVEFPEGDCCACCGLHVKKTGEIGIVKLLSVKRFRSGARIEMVAGKRALRFLNEHYRENSQIAVLLSVKPTDTKEAVLRLQEENYGLKGKVIQLQKERITMRTEQCQGKKDVVIFEKDLEAGEIQKETDRILDTCEGICIVLSEKENHKGYQYAVGQRNGEIRDLVKEINQELQGKGGGKPSFAQGFLKTDRKTAEKFFKERSFTIL